MISDESFKAELDTWFNKRIRELENVKKLHRNLLGLKKDEYMVHQEMMDNIIYTYAEIGSTLIEGEGKISSIPKEIKSDMVAYLKRKAQDYDEAGELAEIIHERVPNSSQGGRVSKPWLKRRGKTKADLVWKDGIQQIGATRKIYKGLELE